MERNLRKRGYRVVNQGYPSRQQPIEVLVDKYVQPVVAEAARRGERVHFVTHSLGGILVRTLLKEQTPDRLGRVVMLSPPNQGSEIADLANDNKLLRHVMGPVVHQLGTGRDSVPRDLGRVDFELGVIAGSCPYNPLISRILGQDNDGLLSVSTMRVAGMADFCILPVSHTLIMNNRAVMNQTLAFLQQGRFIDSRC